MDHKNPNTKKYKQHPAKGFGRRTYAKEITRRIIII